MAPLPAKLVVVARSDGQKEVGAGIAKRVNKPKEVRKGSGNKDERYEEIPLSDDKSKEWRTKLGLSLLKAGTNDSNDDQVWMLRDFPENYTLWTHSRNVVTTSKAKKEGKRRADAYLYGHPNGPSGRYRSPAEFLPHLMWLATDESADRSNCGCKLCFSDASLKTYFELANKQMEHLDPKTKARVKKDRNEFLKDYEFDEEKGSNGEKGASRAAAKEVIEKKASGSKNDSETSRPSIPFTQSKETHLPASSNTTNPVIPIPPTKALTNTAQPRAYMPPNMNAFMSPPPTSLSQAVDAEANKFLYRPGELVWSERPNSWGLGIVVDRTLSKDQRQRPLYTVQLLSHPYEHPELQNAWEERKLRPWLAFSAPEPTNEMLRQMRVPYNAIDWSAVIGGQFGSGDPEVDASIFAARVVDASYTLVHPLPGHDATSPHQSYAGLFSGAEKIWLGEAVRIRSGQAYDILVLHQIVATTTHVSRGNGHVAKVDDVSLVGDVYTFRGQQYDRNNPPSEQLLSPPSLPARVIEDLKYRNRATLRSKSTYCYWKMVSPQQRVSLKDVKGRWYESRLLMPLISGEEKFVEAYGRGEIEHVGGRINGRGSCTQSEGQSTGVKVEERMMVFGAAVPRGTAVKDGYVASMMQGARMNSVGLGQLAPGMNSGAERRGLEPVGAEGKGAGVAGDGDVAMSEFVDVEGMGE